MFALIDILAKKDDAEALIFVVVAVVVGVVIAVANAAQKRKQAQARAPRPAKRQTQRWQAPPQVAPAPPQVHTSTTEEAVAKQLAPEMVSMMHARNLTPQAEKVAAAKFSFVSLLKNRNDMRRALILNELLNKPLALRRK